MTDFEAMSDDEFNGQLSPVVATLDHCIRSMGHPTVPEYRHQLVEMDRYCMELVEATAYAYIRIPYSGA